MFRSKIIATLTAVAAIALFQVPAIAATTPSEMTAGPTVAAAFDVSKAYDTDLVIGYSTAPVTVIEYGSLTCPHCAHFSNEVFPTFKKDWVDTGKVRFVYRHFPLDQIAFGAASAVTCLPIEQQLPAIETLYKNQSDWESKDFEHGVGVLFQKDVDPRMDLVKVKACAGSKENFEKTAKPSLDARRAQAVPGTPAIFINGTAFEGERSIAAMSTAVQAALAVVETK